jgi:hypothetical protein
MKLALSDPFWVNRQLALEFILEQDLNIQKTILEKVIKMAPSDPKPQVRALAFKILSQNSFDRKKAILEIGIKDSSISVSQAAYKAYIKEGYPDLAEKISSIPKEEQKTYGSIVADFYASKKGSESFLWFKNSLADPSFSDPYELIHSFGKFMQISDSTTTREGLDLVYNLSIERKKAEIIIATYQILKNFQNWPDVKNKRKKIKEVNKSEEFGEVLDYLE